jgi:hypothetical protein
MPGQRIAESFDSATASRDALGQGYPWSVHRPDERRNSSGTAARREAADQGWHLAKTPVTHLESGRREECHVGLVVWILVIGAA